MKYTCEFTGRNFGAIGVMHHIVDGVDASDSATFDEIRIKLYDKYEHIMGLTINGRKEEDWDVNNGN